MNAIFKDLDGNVWNIKLKIEHNKLIMYSTAYADFEPLEVDLKKDDIVITEK